MWCLSPWDFFLSLLSSFFWRSGKVASKEQGWALSVLDNESGSEL